MLQNASLLAIVAVHTAENEPSEVGDAVTATAGTGPGPGPVPAEAREMLVRSCVWASAERALWLAAEHAAETPFPPTLPQVFFQ